MYGVMVGDNDLPKKRRKVKKKKLRLLLLGCTSIFIIGLTTDRKTLYDKINKRVDKMIEDGLENEAKKIYNTGVRSKAVTTPIGYKEFFEYFDDVISKEEAIELIKKRSRKYAKRQYTWFNNKLDVNWFNVNFDNFNETIKEIKKYIEGD